MMTEAGQDLPLKELTGQIIGMAMKIHSKMGSGYLESVYHRCIELELAAAGLPFESHKPLPVFYEGRVVGNFEADLVINSEPKLMIELKAIEALQKSHEVQLVNYLHCHWYRRWTPAELRCR